MTMVRNHGRIRPVLDRPATLSFTVGGELGRRLHAITENWLLPVVHANPRILEMFRERDMQPYASQVPWAGEFAGKHLTAATQVLRITGDTKLRDRLQWFVGKLVSLQAADGYLGPWPKEWRLRPGAPNCARDETWDAWGHYHLMLGLLLWYDLTADEQALDCASRIAGLLIRRFLDGDERLHDTGEHEKNQAPVHSLAMLYQVTGDQDCLALAQKVVEEFALPPAGDYYRQGLANIPFSRNPKPRWESLHPIMGLVELYYATGDPSCRQAFESLWWSMLEGDRHNNGGFTSGERATGNPHDEGAIETCCTVAWSAMTVEMLKLTGNPVIADELELTLLNSGFGMMSPSGRWVTYNTPMDGVREASAHTIVFQARAGSPELNCCSVNGPRLPGLLSEWALLTAASGELHLNWYGPGTLETALPSGRVLRLTQQTAYPVNGRVEITLELGAPETFSLALRIPAWSRKTRVQVAGDSLPTPEPAHYLSIERCWKPGDTIRIDVDMDPHFRAGRRGDSEPVTAAEKLDSPDVYPTSIYRGPLLLAYDTAFNGGDTAWRAGFDAKTMAFEPGQCPRDWLAPQLLLRTQNIDGTPVQLCDFASAGLSGSPCRSRLPVRFPAYPIAEFDRNNSLRTTRVDRQT